MPHFSKSALPVRLNLLAMVTVLGIGGAFHALAQTPIPGQTTNMVTGTQWPNGDPFLQRQNEPSMAISSENPMHVVAGDNDYRTVDVPFPLGTNASGEETGDAWLGFFTSLDGGFTWTSTLLPGYPQDTSAQGSSCVPTVPTGPQSTCSPIKGYQAAADPTVRAAPSGVFVYAGLAFNRDEKSSAIFISRYVDYNNNEAASPITYLDTQVIAQSTPMTGTFLDKPTVAIQLNYYSESTCSVGSAPSQLSVQPFSVYVAWTVFTGPSQYPAQIWFSQSNDCGVTFSAPQQVSNINFSTHIPYGSSSGPQLNQGAQIAIDPNDPWDGFIFWRQFADTTTSATTVPDAISGVDVSSYAGIQPFFSSLTSYPNNYVPITPFDQSTEANQGGPQITTPTEFRTNAYVTVAVDGYDNFFMAWSQRGGVNPSTPDQTTARISYLTGELLVGEGGFLGLQSATLNDVDDNGYKPGHQMMPAMAYAAGKLTVAWYDFRDDDQTEIYTDTGVPGSYTVSLQADGTLVFGKFVADPPSQYAGNLRHTVDVRAAQMPSNASYGPPPAAFNPSVQVSSYQFGTLNGTNPSAAGALSQLQYNAPDLPLFETGSAPFMGDYIDVAGPTFINDPMYGGWRANVSSTDADYTRVVWTDNRDVVAPADGNWQNYTPVALYGAQSVFNSAQTTPSCQVGQTGMRNQNLYTAPVTPGLIIGAQGNSKVMGEDYPVGFAITLQNTTTGTVYYNLTLPAPGDIFEVSDISSAARARRGLPVAPVHRRGESSMYLYTSFVQNDVFGFFNFGPLFPPMPTPHSSLVVAIPPLSTATRTVFAALQGAVSAPFEVTATQVADANGDSLSSPGVSTYVLLDPDFNPGTSYLIQPPNPVNTSVTPSLTVSLPNPNNYGETYDAVLANPNIANPNIANPNIANPNIANPNIANPNIANPNIANPNIANPNIANITITNADIMNPNIANPNIANPNIANPNIANPNIANPNIANPNIANPNIANISLSDASYVVTNFGNTTAAYTVLLQNNLASTPSGVTVQVVVSNVYGTPVADGCVLTTQANLVPLINDTTPTLLTAGSVGGNQVNPPAAPNADTFVLAPGASALLTIRAYYPPGSGYNPLTAITPVVYSQGVDDPTINFTYYPGGPPPSPPALTVTTASLSTATATQPYSQSLTASGGTGTGYTWKVPNTTTSTSPDGTSSVANGLPPGLTIATNPNGTGAISGTPSDTFNGMVTIQVTDSGGFSATRVLNLTVQSAANLKSQTVSLVPSTKSTVPYYSTFTVTASSNAPIAPTLTVSGSCSKLSSSGTTYSFRMTSGTGDCNVSAMWPGNATYATAYADTSLTAVPAITALTFTGTPKLAPDGSTFPAGATSNVGVTPAVTATGACTVNPSTNQVTITAATGTCNLSATVLGGANYSTATATLSVPIGMATLTVTANPATIAFGSALPAFGVTYSGFVPGDTQSVISGTPSFTTNAAAYSLPGTYTITPGAGTLHYPAYYTLKFVAGTLTITPSGTAPANGLSCNGAYNGTFNGAIIVEPNQYCVIDGGTVNGSLLSAGGIVVLMNGAKMNGNMQISGLALGPGAGRTHVICGSTIKGNMLFELDDNPIAIGGASCGTTTITGNLQMQLNLPAATINASYTTISGEFQVQLNAGAVVTEYDNVTGQMQIISNAGGDVASYNTVGGNLQIQSNLGSSQVFSNTVASDLQCSGNATITGGGNKAKLKQGQCANF